MTATSLLTRPIHTTQLHVNALSFRRILLRCGGCERPMKYEEAGTPSYQLDTSDYPLLLKTKPAEHLSYTMTVSLDMSVSIKRRVYSLGLSYEMCLGRLVSQNHHKGTLDKETKSLPCCRSPDASKLGQYTTSHIRLVRSIHHPPPPPTLLSLLLTV